MPNCNDCGEEISEDQAIHFNNLCPECVRISRIESMKQNGRQKSSVLKWCLIAILLLLILPMIVFTFFLFR